jgi:hypothetical protein
MKGASKEHGNVEQDKNASVLLRAFTLVFALFAKKQRFGLAKELFTKTISTGGVKLERVTARHFETAIMVL